MPSWDRGSRAATPDLIGEHKKPIGFCREHEAPKTEIEIFRAVPVELLKKTREAFEEMRKKL